MTIEAVRNDKMDFDVPEMKKTTAVISSMKVTMMNTGMMTLKISLMKM